jgi:hypothetical protein
MAISRTNERLKRAHVVCNLNLRLCSQVIFECPHDVTLYKQQWCKDGYFLPAVQVSICGILRVLHMTSLQELQELRIIARDRQVQLFTKTFYYCISLYYYYYACRTVERTIFYFWRF